MGRGQYVLGVILCFLLLICSSTELLAESAEVRALQEKVNSLEEKLARLEKLIAGGQLNTVAPSQNTADQAIPSAKTGPTSAGTADIAPVSIEPVSIEGSDKGSSAVLPATTVESEAPGKDEMRAEEMADEPPSAFKLPTFELTKTEREDSPEFVLGKETGPNMKIRSQDNPDLAFQLGIRFMGTAEYQTEQGPDGNLPQGGWDFYARRVRFEAGAHFSKDTKFIMDVRNDRSNQDNRGEGDFNVGDAKLTVKRLWDQNWLNAAFYRAKVDVSRTETVKSGFLINYDRAPVADSAANWVSENRRATNAQLFGDFDKKIHYQLAVGDGLGSGAFRDARGRRGAALLGQSSPMFGGKIRFSPFDGWEEVKRTETYFGQGKHFSVGVGQFYLNSIDLVPVAGAERTELDRELTNIEASAHYGGAFIQAEYFLFDGAVADLSASTLDVGESDGWYVLAEYVFPELGYLSPFARYDTWDRFSDLDGFGHETISAGLNWYLRGNSTKVGFVYQRDNFEEAIGRDDTDTFRIISQVFF